MRIAACQTHRTRIPMKHADRYPHLHGQFHWDVPKYFNIAESCGRRWASETPQAVAIIQETEGAFDQGPVASCTFGRLQALSLKHH